MREHGDEDLMQAGHDVTVEDDATVETVEEGRRSFGRMLGLLGGGLAASLLAACERPVGGAPPPFGDDAGLGTTMAALTGGSLTFVSHIGIAPASPPSTATNCLRNITPAAGQRFALVGSFWDPVASAGLDDGGGGLFYWDATSRTDDGGLRINPGSSAGGNSLGPGWQRIATGPIDVRWFGATGHNTGSGPDDAVYIQRAIVAARRNPNWRSTAATTGFSDTLPTGEAFQELREVFVPAGQYRIASTLEVPDYIRLFGERGSTLYCVDDGIAILRLAGRWTRIERLNLVRGKHSIVFFGLASNPDWAGAFGNAANFESTVVVRDCLITEPVGPAIYHRMDGVDARMITGALLCDDVDFTGAVLYWGSFDQATFRGGRIKIKRSRVTSNPEMANLGVFNSSGVLNLENLFGVPESGMPPWIVGHNVVNISRCRLAGEAGGTTIMRVRHVHSYDAISLAETYATSLSISDSTLNATQQNWLEIYDVFPLTIDVRTPLKTTDQATAVDLMALAQSFGVWVDSAIDMDALARLRFTESCEISFRGHQSIRTQRFRQSANPLSEDGVDLAAILRPFFNSDTKYATRFSGGEAPAQPNKWWSSYPHLYEVGVSMPGGTGVGITWDPTPDNSTGYAIRPMLAVTGSASPRYLTKPLLPWGANEPAGEYVLSCYVKANYAGSFRMGLSTSSREVWRGQPPLTLSTDSFTRVSVPLYKPTSAESLQLCLWISNVPSDGRIWMGMFAMHHGNTPAPYVFPGNACDTGLVPARHYAQAAPTSGNYKRGDVVYNSWMTPSNPTFAWVCTNESGPQFAPVDARGSGVSGSRPTGVTPGYQFFDTTLGKPIWWQGTVWVDASGSIVVP